MPEELSAPAKSVAPVATDGNVKETIESILVAFILAFVFRAFVVEAFVIPTGSMAPTLMGAHMRYHCDDCGYRWDVNYKPLKPNDLNIPSFGVFEGPGGQPQNIVPQPLHCPNCGYPVRLAGGGDRDNGLSVPPVHYGDRILVLKYLYLFEKPRRWDVVVFKAPVDTSNYAEPLYSQNYIKRLVGTPGDAIVILDGDVYVASGPLPHRPDGQLDTDRVDWSAFHLQPKPWFAQEALWRNVYDNDYLPHLPADGRKMEFDGETVGRPWRQPWTPAAGTTGWDLGPDGRSRAFRFDNAAGRGELSFDPAANPDTYALTDHIAYDELDEHAPNAQWPQNPNPVGDLKLALHYTRRGGDGPLELELTKAGDTFVATLTPGRVTLSRTRAGSPRETLAAADGVKELAGIDPVRVEFCNLDYRVFLRINGREVVGTTDAQYAPRVADLVARWSQPAPPPAVRLAADRQQCTVEHLSLARDVYYLNRRSWNQPRTLWGDPDKPIELGADEYFVLGDNSFISGDARTWGSAVSLPDENLAVESGRVPGRFLLGKAFFVYWPAGYRPFSGAPGLVPNFGDMRFIH